MKYCSQCGNKVIERIPAGDSRLRFVCGQCEHIHYQNPHIIAGCLPVYGDQVLLCKRAIEPRAGRWTLPAGFLENGETSSAGALRETREEAGITCGRIKYYRSQPWPFPTSLMIGCHAQALNTDIVIDRNELEDARWFDRQEVVAMLMRNHPDGLTTPPPMAIAHHLIRAWVEDEIDFD